MTNNGSFVKRVSRPVAAVLLFTGCFHYVPAEVPPLPGPQTEVRITLSEPWNISMGEFTLHDVLRIEGIVVEASGDTLDMVARWLHPRIGRKYEALYSAYDVPITAIQQLEQWRFAGKRTVLVLGAAAAGTALLVSAVWKLVRGSGPSEVIVPPASVVAPR